MTVLTTRGHVTLGGVQFTNDPATYNPTWPKRSSVTRGLAGAVTIQDFGVFAADQTIRLASGDGQWLSAAAVVALEALAQDRGAVHTFTDWLENEFTVFIVSFQPIPTFMPGAFTYDMELHVTAITKRYGVTYEGD